MKHDLPAFALLIDADNVRTESVGLILEEITRHARVTVRRIYGDFTTPNLAGWKVKLAENAIHPIQQYRNSVGKNASDSALFDGRARGYNLRLVRYVADCPLSGGKVSLQDGGLSQFNRLVGCCDEKPVEHVYSFDRKPRAGCWMRGRE